MKKHVVSDDMAKKDQHKSAGIDLDWTFTQMCEEAGEQSYLLQLAYISIESSRGGKPDLREFLDASIDEILAYSEEMAGRAHSHDDPVEFMQTQMIFQRLLYSVLNRYGQLDGMTGVFNKVSFGHKLDELIERLRHGTDPQFAGKDRRVSGRRPLEDKPVEMVAAFMIDLDKFKNTNDDIGHDAGDSVLIAVANRLQNDFPGAIVGRLGGDEFSLAIPVDDLDQAMAIDRRLKGMFEGWSIGLPIPREKTVAELREKNWEAKGRKVTVPILASVGWVQIDPAASARQNLADADAKMYAMKQRNRGRGPAPVG